MSLFNRFYLIFMSQWSTTVISNNFYYSKNYGILQQQVCISIKGAIQLIYVLEVKQTRRGLTQSEQLIVLNGVKDLHSSVSLAVQQRGRTPTVLDL